MNSTDRQPSRVRRILQEPFGPLIFASAIGLVIFSPIIIAFSLSFRDFGEWSFDEVARVLHPQANVDAVLVETNGGATTSFGYEVFVLSRGQNPNVQAILLLTSTVPAGTNMLTE